MTAQIHFLKNRAPKDWHDRKEFEIYGKGDKDLTIDVRFVDFEEDDQEEKLDISVFQ